MKDEITLLDYKRLEAYSKNLADFHLILDLLPDLTRLFFRKQLGNLKLSYLQAAILIGLGLQHRNVEAVAKCKTMPLCRVQPASLTMPCFVQQSYQEILQSFKENF